MLAWIFVPDTLVVILPTPQTFSALADMVAAAQQIIVEEQAPVGAARPIVLVVASSFGLIVIVADTLLATRQAAPLMGGLLLAVFATPALISGETPSVWLFLLVAALWLVLLRARTAAPGVARRGAGPAILLGAAALVGAISFPAVSPDVSAVATGWGKPPAAVFGRGINPMLELGQNLRRNSTIVALTYTTSADRAQYLKVATLNDFSGRTWKPSRVDFPILEEGASAVDPYLGIERGTGHHDDHDPAAARLDAAGPVPGDGHRERPGGRLADPAVGPDAAGPVRRLARADLHRRQPRTCRRPPSRCAT